MAALLRRDFARLSSSLACLLSATSALAQTDAVADFYRGKTLTLLSGFSASGENDSHLRLVARHLPRHLPGAPTVIVSNMSGAGTMIAANHLYAKGAPDGTIIGMFTAQVAVEPFLGSKTATFEPLKFGWIGSISQDLQFCGITPAPNGPASFAELRQKEAVFGSSAQGSDIYRLTQIMNNVLGAKIKIVSGYNGMPAVILAIQRDEVAGACGFTAAALRTHLAPSLSSGKMRMVIQFGPRTTEEFGKIPSVFEFARNDGERDLLDFFFKGLAIGRPMAVPPGVPPERVAALRAALTAALKDPAFLDEAKKLNMIIDPLSGAEIEAQFVKLSKSKPELFQQVRKVFE